MLHDPKRILTIEKWARWIAWVNLVSAVGYAVLFIIKQINPPPIYPYSVLSSDVQSILFKAPNMLNSLVPILRCMGLFLFLIGMSKTIRFLRHSYAKFAAASKTTG